MLTQIQLYFDVMLISLVVDAFKKTVERVHWWYVIWMAVDFARMNKYTENQSLSRKCSDYSKLRSKSWFWIILQRIRRSLNHNRQFLTLIARQNSVIPPIWNIEWNPTCTMDNETFFKETKSSQSLNVKLLREWQSRNADSSLSLHSSDKIKS